MQNRAATTHHMNQHNISQQNFQLSQHGLCMTGVLDQSSDHSSICQILSFLSECASDDQQLHHPNPNGRCCCNHCQTRKTGAESQFSCNVQKMLGRDHPVGGL